MKIKLKLAFTLIELLVVIAIIGILSGLIIVGMNGMTNSARIAKSQVFSSSLRNSLMLNLVSEWKLDEINASTTTPDSWSGGNTGTLKQNGYAGTCDSTHCPQLQQTNCVSGKCLSFDGSNDYVDCGTDSNLFSNTITVEAWARSPSFSNWLGILSNSNAWGNGFGLQIGTSQNIAATVSGVYLQTSWLPSINTWYHIVATHRNDNLTILYVNGKEENRGTYALSWDASPKLYIGTFYTSPAIFFNGLIDGVRVYKEAIPSSMVKEQYYFGLNKLFINGDIFKEEYLSRIKEENKLISNE